MTHLGDFHLLSMRASPDTYGDKRLPRYRRALPDTTALSTPTLAIPCIYYTSYLPYLTWVC